MEGNFDDLRGRLEVVKLKRAVSGESAIGSIQGSVVDVFVKYGARHVGNPVVARIDLNTRKWGTLPSGNLVSSHIPEDFSSLAPEQHVLYGLWERETASHCWSNPDYLEARRLFNVGEMAWIVFAGKGSDRREGRLAISQKLKREIRGTYASIIQNHLPDPDRSARLMLAEEEDELERIARAIRDAGMYPMRVQPVYERLADPTI
jgi:hypothetical protein